MSATRLSAALGQRDRQTLALPGFAESAVLALLITDDEDTLAQARLVFTVRRDDMRTHAGQISFPGGRRDPGDADLVATALREAEEELGVPRDRVRVLGLLDDVPTPSQFVITPVVGIAKAPLVLAPHIAEVAEVFDCSLAELTDPSRYRSDGERTWQGIRYVMHEYRVGERTIWGATARMLHQLLEAARIRT